MKLLWNKKAHMIINVTGGILILLFGIFRFSLGYYAVSMIINGLNGFLLVDIKHRTNNKSDIFALKICECVFLLFFIPGLSLEHFIRDIGAILLYNGLHFSFLGMLPAYVKYIVLRNRNSKENKNDSSYEESYQRKNYEESKGFKQDNRYKESEELRYFGGCNSIDSLKRRYHKLAKAFHSDEGDGDKETFVKMKAEYEKELKKYL